MNVITVSWASLNKNSQELRVLWVFHIFISTCIKSQQSMLIVRYIFNSKVHLKKKFLLQQWSDHVHKRKKNGSCFMTHQKKSLTNLISSRQIISDFNNRNYSTIFICHGLSRKRFCATRKMNMFEQSLYIAHVKRTSKNQNRMFTVPCMIFPQANIIQIKS